jgi:Mg2+-importing ATPase
MKYVFMAASANFGNMFSMAGASLLLPFLPLMPKQILLINLITDLPEMAIATDIVEDDAIQRPQHWDITYILKFMLRFGLISSIFDFATFAVLHYALKASPEMFRTGWFVDSVVSASLVVLVIRTRGPFWKNRPSSPLLWSTVGVVALALAIPYTPLGTIFGFVPLPAMFMALMGLIVLMYVVSAEMLKIQFFKSRATRSFTVGGSA